jgi:transposase-like protein
MSVLSRPYFHDEQAAFGFVEAIIWPKGPVCPHCGDVERITAIKPNPEKRVRFGLKKCGQCKGQFTVRMGTIFEESKLPMTKWLQAIFLMTASKKGVSAHQLHRTLEVTYKTAWFLAHRIREAMRDGELAPFGGAGGMVEVDETCIGQNPDAPKSAMAIRNMNAMMTLVDRDTGRARSMVVDKLDAPAVAEILSANLAREARLMTDDARFYKPVGRDYAGHYVVATPRASTSTPTTPPSTRTRSRASTRSSSAACAASISTAPRSTCTATRPSSTSATPTARRSAWTIPNGP